MSAWPGPTRVCPNAKERDASAAAPLGRDAYHRRLLVFLSVATFFEGFDFIAISQVLPSLRQQMGLDKAAAGIIVGLVNAGTLVAYLLVGIADRWGRRRVMTVTIVGYTVFTFLTGLAPNVYLFVAAQFLARVFVIGELAVSNVIAAEEFPAAGRGTALGIIGGSSALGAIACAVVTPILVKTQYGWRSVYLVGLVPLVIVAFARRGLRETRRFVSRERSAQERSPFVRVLAPAYRARLLHMAAIWFCAFVASQNTVAFWKDFAVTERGLSEGEVGRSIALAAMVSAPLVFAFGKLMDVIGRRLSAAIVFGLGAIGTLGAYNVHGPLPRTGALILAIFASAAFLPVLNAFTVELFPTSVRGAAFGLAHNLLGRLGYVLSPFVVGAVADRIGWAPAISATAALAGVVILLVYCFLPETRGRELEETSADDERRLVSRSGPSTSDASAQEHAILESTRG